MVKKVVNPYRANIRYLKKQIEQILIQPNHGKLKYKGSADENIKHRLNVLYANTSKLCYTPGKHILYLDGEALRTTKHLERRGIPSQVCYVPNNSRDYTRLYQRNEARGQKRIMLSHVSVTSFLVTRILYETKEPIESKFCSIWLDYCGTFTGSKDYQPQHDMFLIFSKRMLCHKSVFGVTFCAERKHNFSTLHLQDEIQLYVKKLAELSGYRLNLLESVRYGQRNNMVSLFWNVEKVTTTPINRKRKCEPQSYSSNDRENKRAHASSTYEVEAIVDHRGGPGHFEYRVKWLGYPSSQNTWEPSDNFVRATCIKEYWKLIE